MLYCANAAPNRAAVLRSFTMLSTDPRGPRSKNDFQAAPSSLSTTDPDVNGTQSTQTSKVSQPPGKGPLFHIHTYRPFFRPRPHYWFYPPAQAPTAALSHHLASPFSSLHRKCGRAW